MSGVVALDQIYTDKSLYSVDEALTAPNKERMEAHIVEDFLKPREAARRVGISSGRFKNLYANDDMFRGWVDGCANERNAQLMEEVVTTMRLVEDPERRAKLLFDLQKHIDKELGMQVTKIEELQIVKNVTEDGYERISDTLKACAVEVVDEPESDTPGEV